MLQLEVERRAQPAGRRREPGGVALTLPLGSEGSETAVVFAEAEGEPDDVVAMEHLIEQAAGTMLVRGADPAEVAERLSAVVAGHFRERRAPHLSLVLGIVDREGGEFRYVNLDHPVGEVLRGDGTHERLSLSSRKELGEATRAPVRRVVLAPGDELRLSGPRIGLTVRVRAETPSGRTSTAEQP